jgi:hypothetical protein
MIDREIRGDRPIVHSDVRPKRIAPVAAFWWVRYSLLNSLPDEFRERNLLFPCERRRLLLQPGRKNDRSAIGHGDAIIA